MTSHSILWRRAVLVFVVVVCGALPGGGMQRGCLGIRLVVVMFAVVVVVVVVGVFVVVVVVVGLPGGGGGTRMTLQLCMKTGAD